MTNTVLLKQKIDRSGYKVVYLAEQVGLTPQGFYKKLKDGSDWTFTQVMILKELLHLTKEEVNSIFFNSKVE